MASPFLLPRSKVYFPTPECGICDTPSHNRMQWKQCFARGPLHFHSALPLEPCCYLESKPGLACWVINNHGPVNPTGPAYNQPTTRHMIQRILTQASTEMTRKWTRDVWTHPAKISPAYFLSAEPPRGPVHSGPIVLSCCFKSLGVWGDFFTQKELRDACTVFRTVLI